MTFTYDKSTNTYTLDTETRQVTLTGGEIYFMRKELENMDLRTDCEEVVQNMIDDEDINIADYPYTQEELVDEVFTDMIDQMDIYDGKFPDMNEIYDHVRDIMDFYEANKE